MTRILLTRLHSMLAYTPFLEPMSLDDFWLILLLPLVIGIAVVHKTIKMDDLTHVTRQSLLLAMQIMGFMILSAVALWVVNEVI